MECELQTAELAKFFRSCQDLFEVLDDMPQEEWEQLYEDADAMERFYESYTNSQINL